MHEVFNLDGFRQESVEPLGTKAKFWFKHDMHGWCLCKLARPGTGEHWSEVISCDIASLLRLPHASYFLATYQGQPAVFTPTIVPKSGALVLGNQLLSAVHPDYVSGVRRFKQTSHTVAVVSDFLKDVRLPNWDLRPSGIHTGADLFVGYLALDALIGNTDRHHENWGVIVDVREISIELAPTFDHASSLGCHETEETKLRRLTTADINFRCEAYAARAKSAFFDQKDTARALKTREAFRQAMQLNPKAGKVWLEIADNIEMNQVVGAIEKVPEGIMSETSRIFAERILTANMRAILSEQ